MARIQVFRFEMWDQPAGAYRPSSRLATRQFIDSQPTARVTDEGALEVDESLIDGNGLTRELGQPGRWAYGALDDHGNAYVVIEPLEVEPRLGREAYPLLKSDTLVRAEEIAAEFNRTGSYTFRGGLPLTGAQIPRLHRRSGAND